MNRTYTLKKSLTALTVLSVAGLGIAAGADAPKPATTPPAGRPARRPAPSKDGPADQEAIQGTWQSLTEEMRGQPSPATRGITR